MHIRGAFTRFYNWVDKRLISWENNFNLRKDFNIVCFQIYVLNDHKVFKLLHRYRHLI